MNFYDLWQATNTQSPLNEVQQVGYDQIKEKQLFGPVYHGTTQENLDKILEKGFKVIIGAARSGGVSHGFEVGGWAGGNIPPPVHFLGYGVYFTQSKDQVKLYNNNSLRGIRAFYLDAPNMEVINFQAPHKMFRWWRDNGYDMEAIENASDYSSGEFLMGGKIAKIPARKSQSEIMSVEQKRVEATKRMTEVIKSKWDAVLFTGKSICGSNLDGNQVCIYDPSRIYLFNPEKNPEEGYYPGDRVKVKGVNIAIKLGGGRECGGYKGPWEYLIGPSKMMYSVTASPKELEAIRAVYHPQLLKVMNENPELRAQLEERATRFEGGFDDSIQQYADYLTGGSLKLNFPENLLERKMKKGERLK